MPGNHYTGLIRVGGLHFELRSVRRDEAWRAAEALGLLFGEQPIKDLTDFLDMTLDPMSELDAETLASFCAASYAQVEAEAVFVEDIDEPSTRALKVIARLNALDCRRAVLFTGTDPMVLAVERDEHDVWQARLCTGLSHSSSSLHLDTACRQ